MVHIGARRVAFSESRRVSNRRIKRRTSFLPTDVRFRSTRADLTTVARRILRGEVRLLRPAGSPGVASGDLLLTGRGRLPAVVGGSASPTCLCCCRMVSRTLGKLARACSSHSTSSRVPASFLAFPPSRHAHRSPETQFHVPACADMFVVTCKGDYPSIYIRTSADEWRDEIKGGGAILTFGATTIEFADTAVFK